MPDPCLFHRTCTHAVTYAIIMRHRNIIVHLIFKMVGRDLPLTTQLLIYKMRGGKERSATHLSVLELRMRDGK